MRILLLTSYSKSIISFRGDLIAKLLREGYSVTVAAPEIDTDIRDALTQMGAHVIQVDLEKAKMNPFRDVSYVLNVIRLIKATRADLVLTYMAKPNIYGSIAAMVMKTKSIATINGLGYAFGEQGNASLFAKAGRKLIRLMYRYATNGNWCTFFQNKDDLRDFIEAGCLRDHKRTRIVDGSGVNLDLFPPAKLPRESVFLMMARLSISKGVREYVEAASLTKKSFPAARFLIAGFVDDVPGAIDREEMRTWEQKGVEYIGYIDNPRQALEDCQVFVLPSHREGTPRATLEAMAIGRPIITSDTAGCRETVIEGENGFLVPVGDVLGLHQKMCWMINNVEQLEEMGKNSRRYAEKRFNVNSVNAKYVEEIKSLAAEKLSTKCD
jgi:glycosyltransferase involved in cell wall biosynthesis